MALYDDYFTNEDKPFAENLNDALLLSNVFDMTVNIEVPKMFSNQSWVNTISPRKCGVSILTLKEGLPSGVSIGTDSLTGNSTLTGTGIVKLSYYPNFNSFGKFKAISWEEEGTIVVNLKTSNGNVIANNISKGTIENQSADLRTLQEIVIEIVLTNATLKSLTVTMENKQQERYGATVGISDVTGLDERIAEKVNIIDIKDNLTSTDIDKPLSANQGKVLKGLVDTKSDKTHNHDGRYIQSASTWIRVYTEPNSTPASAIATNQYCTIYINQTLRLVDFRFYRQNYTFDNLGENVVGSIYTVFKEVSTNMLNIKPILPTPLASYNVSIAGAVDTDGRVLSATNSTGTKTINLRGMWHY